MKWEHYQETSKKSAAYWNQMNINEPTAIDDLFVLLGAFAQQGISNISNMKTLQYSICKLKF